MIGLRNFLQKAIFIFVSLLMIPIFSNAQIVDEPKNP